MITVTTCPHGVDLRFAKCLMCDDPAFHAAARTRLDSVNTATTIPQSWSGHAPDLVRDNKLMHERLAEQDREIARLTELLRIAESKAIPVETSVRPARDADHCDYPDCEQHWTYVATEQRKLLSEARAYVLSFASITKHPTAPADAHDLVRRMDGWIKNSPPAVDFKAAPPPVETEGKRELSATEAASFDKAFSRSPRRVESVLDLRVTVCSECLCAACWQGDFYCDSYHEASTTIKTVRELHALGPKEDPGYWFKSADDGKVNYTLLDAYKRSTEKASVPPSISKGDPLT